MVRDERGVDVITGLKMANHQMGQIIGPSTRPAPQDVDGVYQVDTDHMYMFEYRSPDEIMAIGDTCSFWLEGVALVSSLGFLILLSLIILIILM